MYTQRRSSYNAGTALQRVHSFLTHARCTVVTPRFITVVWFSPHVIDYSGPYPKNLWTRKQGRIHPAPAYKVTATSSSKHCQSDHPTNIDTTVRVTPYILALRLLELQDEHLRARLILHTNRQNHAHRGAHRRRHERPHAQHKRPQQPHTHRPSLRLNTRRHTRIRYTPLTLTYHHPLTPPPS
jgi:hypothetical protein